MIGELIQITAVYHIKSESGAMGVVLQFMRFFQKQCGYNVRKVHTDAGSEFIRALDSLEKQGAEMSTTMPY